MLTARQAQVFMALLRELSVPQVRTTPKYFPLHSSQLFSLRAGGSDGGSDAGQCPAASPLSEAECAGAVSTCWSPGQRDTDCPNNGLCCVSIHYFILLIFPSHLCVCQALSFVCNYCRGQFIVHVQ